MPVGPHSLWAVPAMKSAPVAATSTGMAGTACEASKSTLAPTYDIQHPISSAVSVLVTNQQSEVDKGARHPTWNLLMSAEQSQGFSGLWKARNIRAKSWMFVSTCSEILALRAASDICCTGAIPPSTFEM